MPNQETCPHPADQWDQKINSKDKLVWYCKRCGQEGTEVGVP